MKNTLKIVTIVGPTASGKTGLALAIARKIDGEIIGLDSRQIYKGLPIGTAQPTAEEQATVSHHLIGFRSPNQDITAGEYAKLVFVATEDIQSRGKTPIICGGAGLYYRAITKGIFEGSVSDRSIRDHLEQEYDRIGGEALLQQLKDVDPKYAEIVHPNNRKRLVRALEIYKVTGKPPTVHFSEQRKSQTPKLDLFTVRLDVEMQVLEKRIRHRTKQMIKAGWIEEVRSLLKHYSGQTLHPLDSIGYREILRYLKGELSENELEDEIVLRTRQYAKRQNQWFKKETIDLVVTLTEESNIEEVSDHIIAESCSILKN